MVALWWVPRMMLFTLTRPTIAPVSLRQMRKPSCSGPSNLDRYPSKSSYVTIGGPGIHLASISALSWCSADSSSKSARQMYRIATRPPCAR